MEAKAQQELKGKRELQDPHWVELHTPGGVSPAAHLEPLPCTMEGSEQAIIITEEVDLTSCACPTVQNTHWDTDLVHKDITTSLRRSIKVLLLPATRAMQPHVSYAMCLLGILSL